jgi:hypothetical protein
MTDGRVAPSRPSPARRRLPVVLVVLWPAVAQALVVAAFGESMLLWDEFVYVEPLRAIGEGRPWLHWIWHQHNEHRIVWTKLLLFAHAGVSRWNPVVEMYASALMMGVISWGIWRLYQDSGRARPAYFIPVALLLSSLAQYVNMLYGMQTCHYFSIAGMVWAMVFLARDAWRSVIAAALLAGAATVSTLNAIVIWPIGFVVLFLTRRPWPRWAAWAAALAGCTFAYFWHYDSPGHRPDWSSAGALSSLDAFLMNVGQPLAAGEASWSRGLGLMTLTAMGVMWAGVWSLKRRESQAGLVALSLMSVGTAAAIAAMRSPLGAGAALESKYVTYSTLGLIGAYLGLASLPRFRGQRELVAGLTVVVCVGTIVANRHGLQGAHAWQRSRRHARYLLQTMEMQPDESLGSVFFPSRIREATAYLRGARLGPFRDPVDALLAPRWRDATATGPILGPVPLDAHVLCPVERLADIGVVVLPPPSEPGRGIVRVTVSADGAVVAEGEIDAATVHAPRLVRAALPTPLAGCRGKDLFIHVSSDSTDPASSLLSWTYPVYYAGVARRGSEVFDQRSLGIAFNAFSYGLVE